VGVERGRVDFKVKDKMLNGDGSCGITSDPLGCVTGNKAASIFSPKLGVVLGLGPAPLIFSISARATTATMRAA